MHRLNTASALIILCLAISGCSQSDRVEITEQQERSAYRLDEKVDATSDERFRSPEETRPMSIASADPGAAAPGIDPNVPQGEAPFEFEAPEGWTQVPATQFRNPNFIAGPNGEVQCYVSVVAVGGGVRSNADRWRGQMEQEAFTDEEYNLLPRSFILGHEAVIVDFEGTFKGMGQSTPQSGYRLVGALVEAEKGIATVKMIGPNDAALAERNNFAQFVMSLKDLNGVLGTPPDHPDIQQTQGEPTSAQPTYTWTVPEGWRLEDTGSAMRLATFRFGPDGVGECYITILGGDGGGLLSNYNRWLGQLGESHLEESELDLQPRITIFGEDGPMLIAEGSYEGMRGDSIANAMLLGAAAQRDDHALFIKLIAPRALGQQNWETFKEFCASIKQE